MEDLKTFNNVEKECDVTKKTADKNFGYDT